MVCRFVVAYAHVGSYLDKVVFLDHVTPGNLPYPHDRFCSSANSARGRS